MMASLRHAGHIDPPMSRSMWDWIHSDDLPTILESWQ